MLLPVGGAPIHAQPMTAFPERSARQLWFFTRTDTDMARQVAAGSQAMFILEQRDLQACIAGVLSLRFHPARIERYLNPVAAARHPAGRHDPKLTMFCPE